MSLGKQTIRGAGAVIVMMHMWCAQAQPAGDWTDTWPAALVSTPLVARSAPETPELDVAIIVFDPGDLIEGDVAGQVRNIEVRLLAQRLRTVLVSSNAWGAVRIVPSPTLLAPVSVSARLVHSDGSHLVVDFTVRDASNDVWWQEVLHAEAAPSAYSEEDGTDPFNDLWHAVANRLLLAWESRSIPERESLIALSEMRYAAQLAPAAFRTFVTEEKGLWKLNRLPARNDPMMARVDRIRDYEMLFIDATDEQFVDLESEVGPTYAAWRKASKAQADWLQRYQDRATRRELEASRGSFASMHAVYSSYRAMRIQQQDLFDFALGFSNEAGPTVMKYEDRVVELNGTLESRYLQWRELLADIIKLEQATIE